MIANSWLAPAHAADAFDITGTYRLVGDERKVVATGEVVRNERPQGYITYDRSGRMMVLIIRTPRPRPENLDAIPLQQQADLFRTAGAYSGTYRFDGSTIEHRIDLSLNETWTGTTQVRSVKREGNRLVYTTPPFPFTTDGKMSVATLTWERME